MSFRRQFYIKEEDEQLLPETLQITDDNTTYWTYLSTDSASCFVCKQSGHISKSCPNALVSEFNPTQAEIPNHVTQPAIDKHTSIQNLNFNTLPITTTKRPLSISPSEASSQTMPALIKETHKDSSDKLHTFLTPNDKAPQSSNVKPRHRRKRVKHESNPKDNDRAATPEGSASIEEILAPSLKIFQNTSNTFTMTSGQFIEFLKTSFSSSTGYQDAIKKSNNREEVITIIDQTYQLINNSQMRANLTRLKNKLNKTSKQPLNDSTSEYSEMELATDDNSYDSENQKANS